MLLAAIASRKTLVLATGTGCPFTNRYILSCLDAVLQPMDQCGPGITTPPLATTDATVRERRPRHSCCRPRGAVVSAFVTALSAGILSRRPVHHDGHHAHPVRLRGDRTCPGRSRSGHHRPRKEPPGQRRPTWMGQPKIVKVAYMSCDESLSAMRLVVVTGLSLL